MAPWLGFFSLLFSPPERAAGQGSAGPGGERPQGGREGAARSQHSASGVWEVASAQTNPKIVVLGSLGWWPLPRAPEELLSLPASVMGPSTTAWGSPQGIPCLEQGWRSRNCSHAWGSALPSPGQAPSKSPQSWAQSRYFSSFKVWELIF